MAQFVKRITTDLDKTLETHDIGTLVTEDENSRKIYVDLYRNRTKIQATGTVSGIAKLYDNTKHAFFGTIEGGSPYVVVPKEVCAVPGLVTILIRLTDGTEKTTIAICKGYVVDASNPKEITDGEVTVTVEDLIENLDDLLSALDEAGEALANSYNARPTVYCWGDSLTEGVGGYIMPPDGRNAYMAYGYPAWLAQTFDVVNMGARSENIPAIMARQGADPIVLQESLSIPASKDTPVLVQQVTQIYSQTQGQGFTSKSGALVKIHKEVESPGFNPCVIAGVEGILYRELTENSLSNDDTYNYYFKRLSDGVAVTAPQGTEIKTYAMLHCRNGVAVIWMGANGGASSAADFISKVQDMVDYGKYANYLVIISREFSGSDLTAIKTAFTDGYGVCHVISLMDELPYRGYAMAGIQRKSIDTSEWSTTDLIKKNAPLLCEYLGAPNPPNVYMADGGTGLNVYVNLNPSTEEDRYGALHYSIWGYKAIAKLVQEKLGTMSLAPGIWKQTDEYGTLLYKLPSSQVLTGYNYIDTGVKLFDDVDKDWTMAIKWSGTPVSPDGYPANIFCCAKDGAWKGVLYRYYQADGANLLVGSGPFSIDGDHNIVDNYGETNVVVITKSGNSYGVWCNSETMAYGQHLEYTLAEEDATNLSLIIGARYNSSGNSIQYKTGFTVEDVRVYNTALTDVEALALYEELSA